VGKSYSRFTGTKKEGRRLYAWCVFADVSNEELALIREIEYTLHPSFIDPVRNINDPTNCFALPRAGAGEVKTQEKPNALARRK
jgi:transcription initiation factor IIF auxiliary subunit